MATESNLPFPTAEQASVDPATMSNGGASHLQGNGNDLMSRVVQGAHQTIDRLAESAAPHVQRLSEGVSGTSERVHAQVDHLREVGDEWTESLRMTVREHPLAALGLALAAGMLIAKLTR